MSLFLGSQQIRSWCLFEGLPFKWPFGEYIVGYPLGVGPYNRQNTRGTYKKDLFSFMIGHYMNDNAVNAFQIHL